VAVDERAMTKGEKVKNIEIEEDFLSQIILLKTG
jgi:hypothetical protein